MGSGVLEDHNESVSDILDDTDRERRHFNSAGLHDIKTIFKGTIPEGIIETLEDKLENYTHISEFRQAIKDYNVLRDILGLEICTEVSKRILVNDTTENILSHVALKLFESYRSGDAVYNDIEELQRIAQTVYNKSGNGADTTGDLDSVLKELRKLGTAITSIEEHEEKMKLPRYDLHDMDIRLV